MTQPTGGLAVVLLSTHPVVDSNIVSYHFWTLYDVKYQFATVFRDGELCKGGTETESGEGGQRRERGRKKMKVFTFTFGYGLSLIHI